MYHDEMSPVMTYEILAKDSENPMIMQHYLLYEAFSYFYSRLVLETLKMGDPIDANDRFL